MSNHKKVSNTKNHKNNRKKKNSSSDFSDIDLFSCDFEESKDFIIEEIKTYTVIELLKIFKTALLKKHIDLIEIILGALLNLQMSQKEMKTFNDVYLACQDCSSCSDSDSDSDSSSESDSDDHDTEIAKMVEKFLKEKLKNKKSFRF